MTTLLPITGGCFCGRIRYQLAAMPISCGICHCQSCRKIAGAESVGWAVNQSAAFTITDGQPHTFTSSKGVERSFCSECGSTLTYRDSDETIDVTLSTLDDPELLPPTKETWCEDRLSWNQLNPLLAHHERSSSGGQIGT